MVSGFKQFILRGNVVDLAVGVVIGGAFGTIVTAYVGQQESPKGQSVMPRIRLPHEPPDG